MKKILLANGCSWTAGGGLDRVYAHPLTLERKLWPHHLKNIMQYDECHNISKGCGSNQRIVRTTFNWLLNETKERLKNTVAVIQWTEMSRYEYYHPTSDDPYEDIPRNWAMVKAGLLISPADPLNYLDSTLERSQRRYETLTEIEMLYNHLQELETLHSLFNEFGVKYYYWNFNIAYSLINHRVAEFIRKRYNWLEHEGKHIWQYERIGDHDPHPSENGHKQLANYIHEAINRIESSRVVV
jgi:hypothetical protein